MAEETTHYDYGAEADALVNLYRQDPTAAAAIGKALGYNIPAPADAKKSQLDTQSKVLDVNEKAYDATVGRAATEAKSARDLARSSIEDVALVAENLFPGDDNAEKRAELVAQIGRRGETSLTPDRLQSLYSNRFSAAGAMDNANPLIGSNQTLTAEQQDAVYRGLASIGAQYGMKDANDLARQYDKNRGWFTMDDETNSPDNKIRGLLYDAATYSNKANGAKRDSSFWGNDPFDDDVLDGFVDGVRKTNGGNIDYQQALVVMDRAFAPDVAAKYAKEAGVSSPGELFEALDNADNPRRAWSNYYKDLYQNADYFLSGGE